MAGEEAKLPEEVTKSREEKQGDPELAVLRQELSSLCQKHGLELPDRGDTSDPEIRWRSGRPDFTRADLAFCRGRTSSHAAGSLARIVEDLVKRWEMELTHKLDWRQWTTVDPETFSLTANGGRTFNLADIHRLGNYQALLEGCRRELYDPAEHDFDSSHHLFRGAFPDGFAWEVVRVFSGPPRVGFSWRHWARFSGEFRGRAGAGQTVEMYGFCVANVTEKLTISQLEVFYDPDAFLEVLLGARPAEELKAGAALVGSGCPIIGRAPEQEGAPAGSQCPLM